MDFDNGTTFGYINNTPILNGTHIIIINCSTGSAETNTTLTFKIDIASPIIDSSLDLNNTYITINQTFQINYTDDVLLWGFNYSIDGVYQYNITNLTTAFYVYNGSINGSTYSLGQHNLSTTGCDAHTDECIKDFEIIKDKSRIAFDNVDVVSVFSAKRSITEKKIDRYRFGFEYYTPTKEIEIIVPKECTYIDNPHYKGWFVCPGDKKWIDFEGPYDVTVTKDKEFYIVNIKSDKPLTTFMFDSIGELNCNTETYLWFNMGRLNVSSYFYNGSIINNFDVYVNGSLYGSSTTGTINIDNLTEGSYNITVDNPAYELKSQTVLVNESYKAINFSLYTSNSINITILNEDTGNPVTDNITIQFSSLSIGFENITNTSKLYVENLTSGIWAILFTGVDNGYSPKTYYITVGNRSHSSLTAYLSQNYSQTIFTALDKDTSEVLDNVLASMYRSMGGVWTVVESKYTDITGKVQFAYIENVNYQFFFSREDYSDYVFVLTPILFNQYDVKMEKDSRQDQFPDYDRVSILYYPKIFNNNDTTNFTFIIQNPYGELLNYGFNATYPGGTTTQTGINVVGEMFEVVLNITGGVFGDNVDIDFWYNSALTGYKNFTAIYPITFLGSQPTTMMANRDNTYGLGLFERMLFVVIFVIVVVGISTLVGRPIEGMAFGLFLFGVFVYMGFIPLWSVLISIFLGLILLSAKGGR